MSNRIFLLIYFFSQRYERKSTKKCSPLKLLSFFLGSKPMHFIFLICLFKGNCLPYRYSESSNIQVSEILSKKYDTLLVMF